MPQQATTPQTDDNYTAIDPKRDPVAFVYQNKEALGRMDPDKAIRFVDMIWRRYALPKFQSVNKQRPLDEDEVQRMRVQFAAKMLDIPYDKELILKDPEVKYGKGEKTAAALEAGGAGVLGGIRTISELMAKLDKTDLSKDPIHQAVSRAEKKAYENAQAISPSVASIGAGVGHQLPAAIATHGVEGLLPTLAKGAPLALRTAEGGARGAAGGATFEATRPGGDPKSGAMWGGTLGLAFPMLGKLLGLGKNKSLAQTVVEGVKPGEVKEPASPKSLGDLADSAAKSKYGKSFKDLTSAEKAQMPSIMKEELVKQRAQQAATKKAESAAAKAGREADAVTKRAEKAKAASAKAGQQAEKRAAVPSAIDATTPVAKQAVAAQAATENPNIAKIMSGFKEGEGTSAAKMEPASKDRDFLVNEAKHEIDKAKDILKNKAATSEEKRIARENLQLWSEKHAEYTKTIVPEGVEGKKVRAKEGQPASPAQQAADRERQATKRAEAKGQEFGAALEKHAQELAGKHTVGSVGVMHIPELEDAMKEFPNGELFLKGFQKLRKAGRITDEIYMHEMKEWIMTQFEAQP